MRTRNARKVSTLAFYVTAAVHWTEWFGAYLTKTRLPV